MKKFLLYALSVLMIPLAQAADMPETGLRVWLKADAISGLNDGDKVASWSDSSGNNFHAANVGATNHPTYITNGVNGLPIVRFDGKTNYLMNTAYTHNQLNGTLVVVVRRNGLPSNYHNILIEGPSSMQTPGNSFFQIYGDANQTLLGNFSSNTLDAPVSPPPASYTNAFSTDTFMILFLVKDASGTGSSQLYADGALKASGTGHQALGTKYYLGGWRDARMNADVAEVLIYNSALTIQDRQLAEGLLAWKYDLKASLPADHPWKGNNPFTGDPPFISNLNPTNLTLTSATLQGFLTSTGTSPTAVSVYWGTADGGDPAQGLWACTNLFLPEQWAAQSTISCPVDLPASNRVYFYRFAASNEDASVTTESSLSFLAGPITLTAAAPQASESGTNGLITVSRDAAATNGTVSVSLSSGGTAGSQDFTFSPATITSILLPEGVDQTNILIRALPDRQAEPAETVTLQLQPGLYLNGDPSSATVTINASEAATQKTIAYWRFEDPFSPETNSIGFLADSSGGNHNFLADGGLFNSLNQAPFPYMSAPYYYGSNFFPVLPQSGAANAKCFWTPQAAWLEASDSEDWTPAAFTVEAFISPAVLAYNTQSALISHWDTAGNQRSWFLGKPAGTNRIGIILSGNGTNSATFHNPATNWILTVATDYYVAFTFDRSRTNGGLQLYLKNLTENGPLLKTAFNHSFTNGLFNPSRSVIVNGHSGGGGKDLNSEGIRGLFDEIRISEGVLPESELLIHYLNPGTLLLVR